MALVLCCPDGIAPAGEVSLFSLNRNGNDFRPSVMAVQIEDALNRGSVGLEEFRQMARKNVRPFNQAALNELDPEGKAFGESSMPCVRRLLCEFNETIK